MTTSGKRFMISLIKAGGAMQTVNVKGPAIRSLHGVDPLQHSGGTTAIA